MKTMKGQMTLPNLIGLFVVLVVYMVLLPTILTMINSTLVAISGSPDPNGMISALGVILGLVPLIFIISILLTAIGYGTNRQEGYR